MKEENKNGTAMDFVSITESYLKNNEPEKLYEYLANEAVKGNHGAQYCIGFMYQTGNGRTYDLKKAAEWYERAAAQGYAQAQCRLGILYSIWGEYEKSISYLTEAAQQGDIQALYRLGAMYYTGVGVQVDYKKAQSFITEAADKGYAKAQLLLGNMYYNGFGPRGDAKKALELYLLAAEQGNTDAQCLAGKMLLVGEGTDADLERAVKLLEAAAQGGNTHAFVLLGGRYADTGEYSKCVDILKPSVEAGNRDATAIAAVAYFKLGDKDKAIELMEKAVDNSSPVHNTYYLAKFYIEAGMYKKGIFAMEIAAGRGSTDALLDLGKFYLYGNIVKKDKKRAAYFLSIAEERGSREAARLLMKMKSK